MLSLKGGGLGVGGWGGVGMTSTPCTNLAIVFPLNDSCYHSLSLKNGES